MKRILILAALLFSAISLSASNLVVKGYVLEEGGSPIPGVKVTDGFTFTTTDASGAYELEAHDNASFVYITIPSGYETPIRNGAPLFYHSLEKGDYAQRADFELTKMSYNPEKHNFFVWADVQVYNEHELAYVKTAARDAAAVSEAAGLPSFGVSCGDISGQWDSGLSVKIQNATASCGFPFYTVMGNHDYSPKVQTNEASKSAYTKYYGPTYYSFDMGKVHYVVLDDVFYFGRHYIGYLEQSQLEWLKRDLSSVPTSSPVVVFMHIPTYSREARAGEYNKEEYNKILTNRNELYSVLKPYTAHICTGHEHYGENFILADNLMEHVHGPLSGLFWQSFYSSDGLPWGYYVYEVDGTDIRWRYKAVGMDPKVQFSAFETGADPARPECIIANVWNYDPKWKVEWYENGEYKGEMTRFRGWDRNIVNDVENRREKEFSWKYVGAGPCEHMFCATPSYCGAPVEIRVTDRFGEVYTWTNDKEIYKSESFSIRSASVVTKDGSYAPAPSENYPGYGEMSGANYLETGLYNLAVAEMVKNIEKDGTFRTGEKWSGVWTRDVSYSAILSLAHIEPQTVMTSLMKKVDSKGRIIQDTGTGGSWPCSTDREVWAIAAWEVYLETGDISWIRKVYPIIKRSLEADQVSVYNPKTGLYRGESSFIDWRSQSYPVWMQPEDIAQSECLGTNAVFCRALEVASSMASLLGYIRSSDVKRFDDQAKALREAINRNFWMEKEGWYGSYIYGRNTRFLSPRCETLGESLCILWNIASPEQAARIMESMPVTEFGPNVFYPSISAVTTPYHNNGIWPFVTSFYGMAASKTSNLTALSLAHASNMRAAAVFGSHMENMVASDGSISTALNSPRQLWSIAGYIGLVRESLLGIHYEEDGIRFAPQVPLNMEGMRTLKGLKYRNATLNISVFGKGGIIRSFKIDGKDSEPFVAATLEGEHDIQIRVGADYYAEPEKISKVQPAFDLDYPVLSYNEGILRWNKIQGADTYTVYRNGKFFSSTSELEIVVKGSGEYVVIASSESGAYSFISEPVRIRMEEELVPVGQMLSAKSGTQVKFEINIQKTGEYLLDFEYANGNGTIDTHNRCATRTLYVDRKKADAIVLPQRGDSWEEYGWTNAVQLNLSAGKHTIEIRYLDENINMNIDTDAAYVRNLRITNINY